jgi:hypothetical protein
VTRGRSDSSEVPRISELVRGAISAGTSAHELARRSNDAVAHQQFTKLANGEVKGWPKSARAVDGIARALGVDTRAVVLGFAADLGVDVRESRSPLAARLPAEAADLSVEQATTIAQVIRWIADSGAVADGAHAVKKLSAGVRTLRPMHPDPWARFAEDWPAVTWRPVDLGLRWGLTRWADGRPLEVLLHCDLTQVQRRVTIAHECEHLDRGAPCRTMRARDEQKVRDSTARYLIPDLGQLAAHLAAYDVHRAADELWVTYPVLVDRLRGLSDTELERVTNGRGDAVA